MEWRGDKKRQHGMEKKRQETIKVNGKRKEKKRQHGFEVRREETTWNERKRKKESRKLKKDNMEWK